MGYALVRTSNSWARLIWSAGQVHSKPVGVRLHELAPIPGIRLEDRHLDIPCTAFGLLKVQELCRWLGHPPLALLQTPSVPLWSPLRPLYEYQGQGAAKLLSAVGVLLGDNMGLGKTPQAIVAAESVRRTKPDHPVVVIGPMSARAVWEKELRVLGVPVPLCALTSRDIDAPGVWDPKAGWYFVHYDIALAWMTRLQGRKPCVTILDESHYVKNGRVQRSRGAGAIAGVSSRRMLLTGTPIENEPGDLWNQLQIATGVHTWGSPIEFRQRYAGATFNGHGHEDGDPSHVEELQARMEPFYLRRTIADVGHTLPPLTRELRMCELNRTLQQEHASVLGSQNIEQLVTAILNGHVKDHVLEILGRLRHVTAQGKLAATKQAIEDAQAQGESVVVFCWERDTARKLTPKHGFTITGDLDHAERSRIVDTFQSTEAGVLVATYGSTREAVTLHKARIIIMHDWAWVLTQMLQAEARIYRTGQLRACHSIWMCAENSIDTLLARVLYKKAVSMQTIGNESGLEALVELGIDKMNPDGEATIQARVLAALEKW